MRKGNLIFLVLLVLILGYFLIGIRVVDQGEVRVLTTLGKVKRSVDPGFHWVAMPFQAHHNFNSRATVYETSDNPKESKADYTDYVVEANTKDGQQITIRFSVSFSVQAANVGKAYAEQGKDMDELTERVVKYHSRSVVRIAPQSYTAGELYTGDIRILQSGIEEELQTLFESKYVTLDSFVLRKIGFDEDYVKSIEDQQIAREKIETEEFQAQAAVFEAQRRVALATGDADSIIEMAKGDAESTRLSAAAQADAIRLKGQALREFPEVLQLEFVEQLAQAEFMFLPSEGLQYLMPLPEMSSAQQSAP